MRVSYARGIVGLFRVESDFYGELFLEKED